MPVSLLFQILIVMLLTPQFLKQLDPFYIRAKHAFRGKFRGERRSLNRGTGMEFADYRAYEPGDDLRHVDWNIYARLDRLFIKLFHTDEDLPLVLLIDNSRSMEFGSPTKLTRAKQIAAALGYIALAHADSVTIYTCAERSRTNATTNDQQIAISTLDKGTQRNCSIRTNTTDGMP